MEQEFLIAFRNARNRYFFHLKKKKPIVLQLAFWAYVLINRVCKCYRHPTLVGLVFSFICSKFDDNDRDTKSAFYNQSTS